MTQLLEYKTEDGASVVFEVDQSLLGREIPVSTPGDIAATAGKTLEQALDGIEAAAQAVFDRLTALAPDEIALEIGLKVTGESGFIITKVGGEANIGVTLTWKPGDKA